MITREIPLTMEKICRSCMSEGAELRNVFLTEMDSQGETFNLAGMLMACTSVQISSDDGLPVHLCGLCEVKLGSAFEFRRLCERTDSVLRELVGRQASSRRGSSIKTEQLVDTIVQSDEDDDNDAGVPEMYGADSDDSASEDVSKQSSDSKEMGKFPCYFCKKVLRTKKGLAIHQRRHTGDKLRSCQICQAKFTRTNHLRRHMETHNKTKSVANAHECNECDASFSKAFHLLKHKKEHRSGASVKQENYLDENEDREELNNSKNDDDTDKPRGYKIDRSKKVMECEFCDRKFKYRKSFSHHMQSEHGMSDESDVPLSTYVTTSMSSNSRSIKTEKLELQNENFETSTSNNSNQEDKPLLDTIVEDIKTKLDPINGVEGLDDTDLLTKVSNRRMHTCHVCQSKFARANHLTRHMTLHRAILVHKCDKCDKAFATPEYLNKHMEEDHIDKPYVCMKCNKTFGRGEHLIRHLKVHGTSNEKEENLKCSICEKTFSRSDHLARHTKVHLQQDKRHICTECGKAFNRTDNLKTHQRIHAGLKDTSRLHLCVYCGKEFNNSSNMIVHMRRHTGERPYKCSICNKGFPRSHDLKCHERTHSGEKPYSCTLCGKSFNKSNKLLRHTRVHTGERPYVCSLCGRAFTQSNDLALHMRRHTGARPYPCGVCSARFIQSGQLKAHRRSTGHWMETQPDLKGGHRVEQVTPITNPPPIRFKTYGKKMEMASVDQKEEMKEPRIITQAVGIMGNMYNMQADLVETQQSAVIESSKLLQHLHSGGLMGLSTVINVSSDMAGCSTDKFKADLDSYTVREVLHGDPALDHSKLEIVHSNDVPYSNVSSSTAYSSPDCFNYQNYG